MKESVILDDYTIARAETTAQNTPAITLVQAEILHEGTLFPARSVAIVGADSIMPLHQLCERVLQGERKMHTVSEIETIIRSIYPGKGYVIPDAMFEFVRRFLETYVVVKRI